MKRRTTLIIAMAATIAICIFLVRNPPGPHLVCNRVIEGSLDQWMIETTNTWYPNVAGRSEPSLALIAPYVNDDLRDYRYVPGLNLQDPENLVLLYVREQSRRTWHADHSWFRHAKRWLILNPRFSCPSTSQAELSEVLTTTEFKSRLARTLDFIKNNGRTNWQEVVREHGDFLGSLKE